MKTPRPLNEHEIPMPEATVKAWVGRTVAYLLAGGTALPDVVVGLSAGDEGIRLTMQSGASVPLSSITNVF